MTKSQVMFGKPKLKELAKDFLCIDMHLHSKYSDSFTSIKRIAKKAKKKNIGIAITDHNRIKGCLELMKLKGNNVVIPGIEVSSKEGPHFLFYFYDAGSLEEFFEKYVQPFRTKNLYSITKVSSNELIEAAQKYNVIITAAHPCSALKFDLQKLIIKGKLSAELIKQLHSIEVICGRALRNMNLRARVWQLEHDKCFVGGSDGHLLSEMGRVITYSEASDRETFLDNIRKKKNFVVGKEATIQHRALSYSNTISKQSRHLRTTLKSGYHLYFKDHVDNALGKVVKR